MGSKAGKLPRLPSFTISLRIARPSGFYCSLALDLLLANGGGGGKELRRLQGPGYSFHGLQCGNILCRSSSLFFDAPGGHKDSGFESSRRFVVGLQSTIQAVPNLAEMGRQRS